MLFIIPSPIGNLKDITLRAIDLLKSADLILCEDTRVSSKLLQHYQVDKPLLPFHQHNEHKSLTGIINQLSAGKNIALLSDAGTPGISDPAFLLVRACIEHNIRVETLPGATAFVPALVNSGLPIHRFVFEGFLPVKKGRQTLLKELAVEKRTMVFYESPLRLLKTLKDFEMYFGANRSCSISRELSKFFEENKQGTLQEVQEYFKEKKIKGEIVIVVAGSEYG
ncbi:MAG: 16S rRNA (cytidine(1402)-2'-O)-methyltransferase [Bacteroidetes bacterium]|nr:16S rRNA (cytidine(1402)-2'-O)-methyltransferase [Bacteroidota bacterium]